MMRIQGSDNPKLLRTVLDALTGTLLCAWLALTVVLVDRTWPHPLGLMVLLVPVAALVARAWGLAGAVLGLASAVFVFCLALFVPIGRMTVASADAQTSLFWMVLSGSVAGYVFRRSEPKHKADSDEMRSC